MTYKVGILDQSPVFPGDTGADALQKTTRLARKAEEWGYDRFWVAEHHQMKGIAGSSPEVLIAHLLARTSTIKIGAGGIMLQHYSPYKVAENFHVLASLAPGRVDLGVGKSPGGFPLSTEALRDGQVGASFEEKLSFLKQLVDQNVAEDHRLAGIQAYPQPTVKPEIFLLGGSASSAELAAKEKVNLVFAKFLAGGEDVLKEAVSAYTAGYPEGKIVAAVSVLAASDGKEAKKIAEENRLFAIKPRNSARLTVQSYEQVLAYGEQAKEPFETESLEAGMIAGSPEEVKAELDRLHHAYGIHEFILHTPIRREAERYRSFELLRPEPISKESFLEEEVFI